MNSLILLIDDDPEIQSVLARGFSNKYRVVQCRKASLAPRMASRLNPSVIILDAHLGGSLTGFQVCAVLKRAPLTSRIPVLMVSGFYRAREFEKLARQAGAVDYIRKKNLWPGIGEKVARLLRKPQVAERRCPAPVPLTPPCGFGTVLIVDDKVEDAALISTALKAVGFKTIVLTDGNETIPATLQHRPDCIIIEFSFSNTSAVAICRGLQADPAARTIPIIVMTADRRKHEQSILAGADHFVTKDLPASRLILTVKSSIRRKNLSSDTIVDSCS
jgi:DNA-binding response OmpR family regulator